MPELRFPTPLLAHEIALDPEISFSLCNNSGGAEAPTYGRFYGEQAAERKVAGDVRRRARQRAAIG
jgi:hypothetical protein